jgi:hypothetical protein
MSFIVHSKPSIIRKISRPCPHGAQDLLANDGPDGGLGNADPVVVEHPGQLVPAGLAGGVLELSGYSFHQRLVAHGSR